MEFINVLKTIIAHFSVLLFITVDGIALYTRKNG